MSEACAKGRCWECSGCVHWCHSNAARSMSVEPSQPPRVGSAPAVPPLEPGVVPGFGGDGLVERADLLEARLTRLIELCDELFGIADAEENDHDPLGIAASINFPLLAIRTMARHIRQEAQWDTTATAPNAEPPSTTSASWTPSVSWVPTTTVSSASRSPSPAWRTCFPRSNPGSPPNEPSS